MPTNGFLNIVKELEEKEGHKIILTPKELLQYFGYEKRTKYNISTINNFLKEHRLEVVPDYITSYMYARVELRQKEKARARNNSKDLQVDFDPVNRIKVLSAANSKPVSVKKESKLSEAITLMMMHDYSQLPVMQNDRSVVGIITWKSIGQALVHNIKSDTVIDFMSKDIDILEYETPLFQAIKKIIEKEVVLIKAKDNTICGLVTTTDISDQFLKLTEPFLILEEIENHIRKILDNRFTIEEIKEFIKNTSENGKQVKLISDLTFGQYINIIEMPDNWDRLNLCVDRSLFISRLDEVRKVRNDVMHFHPDGISDQDKELLRKTGNFFLTLDEFA